MKSIVGLIFLLCAQSAFAGTITCHYGASLGDGRADWHDYEASGNSSAYIDDVRGNYQLHAAAVVDNNAHDGILRFVHVELEDLTTHQVSKFISRKGAEDLDLMLIKDTTDLRSAPIATLDCKVR